MDIGIIGLPGSGRTTLFNGLTQGKADTGGYTARGLAPHLGIARVPEPRLQILANMLRAQRVVPAEIRYVDINASVRNLVCDETMSGQMLGQLSNVDALINVVPAFADDQISHDTNSIDVARDMSNIDLELAFSDLAIIERRLHKIELSLKGAKPAERQSCLREQELLLKLRSELEMDVPIRELSLNPEESRAIAGYQFLTAKPLLVIVNIGEEQLLQVASLESKISAQYPSPNRRIIALCGKLEMELGQLDDSAANEFRAGFGLEESGLDRVTATIYELLGMISFFTIASAEVKAWSIPLGTSALKAAGKIHTDMERGFIRAEVISYPDLVKCGSIAEARKRGLLRLEGKSYVVQEGDIITFLFNV
jgi:GTP-binding protein YchF